MRHDFVIGLASLPGAGKSELSAQLASLGVEHLSVGTIVRTMAHQADFVPKEESREAYIPFWQEYSQIHGEDWLAQLAIKRASENNNPVVLDGVRIPADAETIASKGLMVWLEANIMDSAARVIARNRPDDHKIMKVEAYSASVVEEMGGQGFFAMRAIKDLCSVHLLPVPEIADPMTRSEQYHALAEHLIDLASR